MKIKSIILNVLFIIILICLIYFFIYLNNSNFEKFDANAFTDGDVGEIVAPTVDNPPTPGLSKYEIEKLDPLYDGKTSQTPLKDINHALVLTKYADIKQGIEKRPVYKDGYYWISIPDVGSSYIYCIMDTNYFGGCWMLAMRSVYGSKNFYYDSPHFKSETTLNDDVKYINDNFKDILKNEEQLAISSIGDQIYKKEPDAPNKFDAKFHTFNKSRATEWMAIFYVINPETNEKIIGGDLKAPSNKRGWIWKENNVDINGEYFSALNLFKELDKKDYQNKFKDLTRKYVLVSDMNKAASAYNMGGKFINPLGSKGRATKNQIFSSEKNDGQIEPTNVYGINYDRAHRLSKMRWGFNFNDSYSSRDDTNDAFSGIGTSYVDQEISGKPKPNQNGYSAGNFEMKKELSGKDVDESRFLDRPIHASFRNTSYAVEWYVREIKY
jgi:hypothetical protein